MLTQKSKLKAQIAFVFLLALGLRLFAIEQQSLWADESGTMALASRSLGQIMHDTLIDVHPPLYYWLLHGWMLLFGQSVLAVRSLSVLCAALAATLTAVLGRRYFGRTTGFVAGIAAALSPFAIYYSQETRMYALALVLSCMLWLALERWLAQPNTVRLALYFACATALLATHYFMITLIVAANVAVLLSLLVCRQQSGSVAEKSQEASRLRVFVANSRSYHFSTWIVGHAILAAFYLGMVWASRTRLSTWTDTKQVLSPVFILSDALRHFSVGPIVELNPTTWLCAGLFLLLLLIGLIRRGPWQSMFMLRSWLIVPLVLMLVLSLNQPYYKPRFLLPLLPAFHLLIAYGFVVASEALLVRIRRWSGASSQEAGAWRAGQPEIAKTQNSKLKTQRTIQHGTFLALLIATAWQPLNTMWFDPRFWRDDYRGAAQLIADTAGPEDGLILNGQSQIDTLNVYEHSTMPRFLLPRVRPLDVASTIAELEQIATTHRRIYALFYVLEESDPQAVMTGWLDSHAYRASSQWFGALQMIIWETGELRTAPQTRNIAFSNGPSLQTAQLSAQSLHSGDGLRVQLHWQGSTSTPHSVFLHLLSADGRLVAQYDGPLSETTRAALLVPPESVPGRYSLVLGLYDPTSSMRLRLADGSGELVLLSTFD